VSLRNKQAVRANSSKQPNHTISDDVMQMLSARQPGASLYSKPEEKAKEPGETFESQGDFLFRDANKSPEERRAVQRIRQPLSPMIQHLLREKEREAKVIAQAKPTAIQPIEQQPLTRDAPVS
jgi:hypothetical protein